MFTTVIFQSDNLTLTMAKSYLLSYSRGKSHKLKYRILFHLGIRINLKKKKIVWGWSNAGIGCLERLWNLQPWGYSKSNWGLFWGTCCSGQNFEQEGWTSWAPEVPSNLNHCVKMQKCHREVKIENLCAYLFTWRNILMSPFLTPWIFCYQEINFETLIKNALFPLPFFLQDCIPLCSLQIWFSHSSW